jgi:hypothetical protein
MMGGDLRREKGGLLDAHYTARTAPLGQQNTLVKTHSVPLSE